MQNRIKEALEGKIKFEELTEEEKPEYQKALAESVKEMQGSLTGMRSARQAEEQKLEDKKKELAEVEKKLAEGGNPPPFQNQGGDMKQFREEQVQKARLKLGSLVKLSPEDMVQVEAVFIKLDSGKMDADFILQDFLSAVAAAKPEVYLDAKKKLEDMEKGAAQHTRQQAGGSDSAPPGQEPKKFSDQAMKLAQEAGITPEAAQKQLTQGMSRTYN